MSEIISQLSIIGEVIIAILLGGLIGYERELKHKPAGLRTHMLIAGAACVLVALGRQVVVGYADLEQNDLINADPIRIIQAIIIGVSFVGSGLIIKKEEEGQVENLTTAASLLFAAAIGISVGVGLFIIAVGLAIIGLIVNFLLKIVEQRAISTH